MHRIHRLSILALLPCLALAAAGAPAADPSTSSGQGWPSRPIRFVTPALPGGTTDVLSRLFSARMTETLGTQVIVDNRGSASGVLGAEIVRAAAPDGYTLFMAYHQHTVNAAMMKLPYHPVNDFTPITQLTEAGLVLVVNPSSPVKNFKEFLAWTRNFKGPLNFGSAGVVSGAVALLLQAEPNLTPDQIKHRLMATANPNWPGYNTSQSGSGYLDVYSAVYSATTESANQGIPVSQMLSTGDDPVTWGSVGWNSVGWNSVGWNSVGWNSVGWNSVGWNSVGWNSSTWDD